MAVCTRKIFFSRFQRSFFAAVKDTVWSYSKCYVQHNPQLPQGSVCFLYLRRLCLRFSLFFLQVALTFNRQVFLYSPCLATIADIYITSCLPRRLIAHRRFRRWVEIETRALNQQSKTILLHFTSISA